MQKIFYKRNIKVLTLALIVTLFTSIIPRFNVHAGTIVLYNKGTTTQDNGWGSYGTDGIGGAKVKGASYWTLKGIPGYYFATERRLDLGKVYTFDGSQSMETWIGMNSANCLFQYSTDNVNWYNWGSGYYDSNLPDGQSEWINVSQDSNSLKGRSFRYFKLTLETIHDENFAAADDITIKITGPDSGGSTGGGSGSGGGKIIFTPNSTSWTNQGKLGESSGSYPVNVQYVGDNPVTLKGTATIHHDEPAPPSTDGSTNPDVIFDYTADFDVKYYLQSMSVSGDAGGNIGGTSGYVYIQKEGSNLHLHAVGTWQAPQYTLPTPGAYESISNFTLPPTPAQPTGDSGYYNLDWTKPTVSFNITTGICNPSSGAIRKASINGSDDGFYGTLTVNDALSGVQEIDYAWTNGLTTPSYKTLYLGAVNTGPISREIEKPVGDNLYLFVRARDIAGNENDITFGAYSDPIKLKNFEVTDVRDPEWDSVFWKDTSFTQSTGTKFKVNTLPLDNTSNPVYHNADIKKGYAFYFDLTSEYLYRDNDRIEISPSFYYWDGKNRIPVDMYYELNNNPFIKFGSKDDAVTLNMKTDKEGYVYIGKLPLLTLTKGVRIDKGQPFSNFKGQLQYTNGKIQWWYGKYFIPATAKFVKVGDSPRPENILPDNHIIVNFTIIAYKNGIETLSQDQIFSYLTTTGQWSETNTTSSINQWATENGPKNINYKIGDVIVYDNKHSELDDYTTLITH